MSTSFLLSANLHAYNLYDTCPEPDEEPPTCTENYYHDAFTDEWELLDCQRDVEYYIDELNEWVECVRNEAEERAETSIEKLECKASGDPYC